MALVFFICGCFTKFKRTKLVDGIFYPNGIVTLEGRSVKSIDKTYTLTISQPLDITELGKITIHDFWGSERKGGYEKIKDQMGGVLFYEAAKTKIQGSGAYYIPVVMLNQNGRFEYHERSPNLIEWIQDHTLLTIFILLLILVVIIIWVNRRITHRQQKQRRKMNESCRKSERKKRWRSIIKNSI